MFLYEISEGFMIERKRAFYLSTDEHALPSPLSIENDIFHTAQLNEANEIVGDYEEGIYYFADDFFIYYRLLGYCGDRAMILRS